MFPIYSRDLRDIKQFGRKKKSGSISIDILPRSTFRTIKLTITLHFGIGGQ